ncbi:hypothetical protein H4Q26_015383 [Puccinia striiformis f. sp. tritici PST-130]|nr:hypothetical protein H4Q26_015383 [Puccinia striiformis f. sp. tritici PST-130]
MLTLGSDVSSSIRDLTKSRLDIFEENMTEEEKQNRRNWRQPGQANPESKGFKERVYEFWSADRALSRGNATSTTTDTTQPGLNTSTTSLTTTATTDRAAYSQYHQWTYRFWCTDPTHLNPSSTTTIF